MAKKFRLLLIVVVLSVFLASYLSQTQKSSAKFLESFSTMSADPTVYYPSNYGLLGLTTYSSGNLADLQTDNSAYMIFNSYQSHTSSQTLYVHRETTTIGGATYYLLKLNSSDSTGTSLSKSVSSTGRKLFGQFVYSLSGVSSIPAGTWTVYYRTWVSGSGSTCHDDADIIVRQSNGTIRTTIATDVANSLSLTTTQQTLSGTYSFSAYTVVNQTDYLEIDYYVHVTTSASRTAYLRIDDNTLGTAQQTRTANVYLPSEYTSEVEFLGSSDTNAWTQLVWTVDSSWTSANVSVTIQLYNFTLGGYPTSGSGYLNYTSSSTANTDETKNQTISTNPLQFRDGSGNWRIKVKGVASTMAQFAFKADLINLAFLDTAPPLWSNAGTNNDVAGQPALFYVKWNDNVGLSGYIFGSNNSGVWTNDTWVQMGGLTNWSNVTKTLNSTSSLLQWKVWANDTSNNWNDTGILSFKVLRPPTSSFTFSPSTPYTGDTVTFNASASTDPDGTIVSYYWTFGDGTNTTGIVAAHAYANNGIYTVSLTVTDNDTLTNTTTKNITVLDRAPVASFTRSLSSAPTGTTISFNASNSHDPDGTIVSYYWSFGDGTNSTGVTASHSYSDNGTYTVTLTVTDDDGSLGTTTAVETISDRPPVAAFTASADNVLTNVIIYFNASASYDPDGTITSFYWSFGDGTNATGMNVQHAYAENGTYWVILTVTDNDLSTASANTTRTILNRPPVAIFTDSGGTVYTGQTITFDASASYDPDGFITSYFWTFGDGTNSTGATASHAYAKNGTYTVSLTLTDNDGAQASSTSNKTILDRPPVASFTTSATTLHKGEILHLNASASYDPDGSIVSYFWTFGDGTNGTGITVVHSYANAGDYTVGLNVTDNDGSIASTSTVITVLNQPPIANFTESPATVYTGDVVSFNASGSYDPDGLIVGYLWTFGDGTNASGVTITHSYVDNGTFVVTLKVTDNDGATASTTATVTVLNRPPIASFTQSPTTVFTGDITTFNASASYDPDGTIVSYFWAFGDGTNGTGLTVGHAYAEDGVYNVILIVTDNDGSTASSVSTRTVLDRPPVASFTKSATSVNTGQTITFNASASYDPDGSITIYFWSFGDGVNATGITVNHAYADNGTYTVILTVTDNDGSKANSTSTVTVLNRPPVASFTASATNVHKNDIVHFNASASYDPDGSIVSYSWSFGDGTNGTGVTVDHSYANAGNYTVGLNVTDNDGSIASTSTVVTVLNQPPVANFTTSATTVYTGDVVSFNSSASYDPDGSIINYLWTFGDGTNATGVTTTHSYVDNGTFVVTLKVTDNDGATATTTATMTILNRPPIASFTQSPSTVFTGDLTTFNASASYDPDGTIVSYSWSFGDGTNGTGLSVTHAYAENGTYSVTLTVKDNDGSTASSISTRTVLDRPPVASFTKSATSVYTGQTITFNASASYDPDGLIVSYLWFFGDGTNSSGLITSHTYADNGTYTVALTVTDNDGTQASSTSAVTILNRSPVASFTASASNVHKNDIIHFNASASYDPDGSIVSYFWTFGDGTNSTGVTIDHSYANAGNYTVTLNVTDNDGAVGSSSIAITVVNQLPIANFSASAATVYTGDVVSFNASGSYDPDGVIVGYLWTFGDGTNATGVTIMHSYADNGTFVVTLKVTDNDGATASTTTIITVLNRPPVASFTETADTMLTGDIIYFDASASYDPDGSITRYFWTFGDGTNATGVTVNHAYADNGTYTVTLTVTDNDGESSSSYSTKTVLNRPPIVSFTKSATSVYTGVVVNFDASASYDPDGSIVSYFWTFGDGTNSTGVITSHAYVDNGTRTVTLTVTDNDGTQASSTSAVTILNRSPVASFTASASNVHKNDIIHFNASASYDPDGTITSYFWAFGDGTNATSITVDHSYANAGTYTVSLTVTDNDGSGSSSSTSINVENQVPFVNFTASPTTVNTGVVVNSDGSASYDPDGVIVDYFWTFGDGFNASGVTAAHSYADNGTFVVTLKVTDNDGATASTTATVTVLNRPPVASFTLSPATVFTGDVTTLNASASHDPDGTIMSYFWTFGDGSNTTGAIVTHAYGENGVYNITLIVTDNDGSTASSVSTRTVLDRPPVASFTSSATSVYTGVAITFNASASYDPDGTILSYLWTFGDGSNATGVAIMHSYADNGTFVVTLKVTDNDGATASAAVTVSVLNTPPVSSFTHVPDKPLVAQQTTFDGTDSYDPDGYIVSYVWNFGDGVIVSGVNLIVYHSFNVTGTYNVTLTVRDNDGYNSTAFQAVDVIGYPYANFSWSPYPYPIVLAPTVFNASSSSAGSGNITTYVWNFGDGNISTTTNPVTSHVFNASGLYNVALTVTNSYNLSSSNAKVVSLCGTPIADFTWTPAFPRANSSITFDASASKPNGVVITGYAWNFGDGTPTVRTISPSVLHTYTSHQAFNVTLSVTNIAGLVGTTSKQLVVVDLPRVDFTWTPASPFAYDVITFNASGSSSDGAITSYTWSFGDGNTTTALVPAITHFYSTANVYVVTLNVTDNYGLSNATSKTLNIVPAQSPLVYFSFSPLLPGVYEQVVFDASGTMAEGGLITAYSWNFGNGTIITVASPVVRQTYQTAGNFTVTLNATNTAGYWSVLSKLVQVMPVGGPKANFTTSPAAPSYNQTLTFDASNSALGWDGTIHPSIVLYTWSFGDNNTTSTTAPVIYHAYSQEGNYTATLTVIDASGRADSVTRTIRISSLVGDVNGDGKVDMRDIAIVAKAFNSIPGAPNWNPIADLNGDGKVDMRDIAIVAKAFNPT